MAQDTDTHAALLADALKLAEVGSFAAATEALRTALEFDFRPDVAAVLARMEDWLRDGGSTHELIGDLRELVEDDGFFGSDLVVADPVADRGAGRSTPFQIDAAPGSADPTRGNAFETAPRKPVADTGAAAGGPQAVRPSTARGGSLDAKLDEGEGSSSARYRGAAPPPPRYRRAGDAPAHPSGGRGSAHELDDFDEFDMFGQPPSDGARASHLEVEPEVVREDAPESEPDPNGAVTAPPPDVPADESGVLTSVGRPVGRDESLPSNVRRPASPAASPGPVATDPKNLATGPILPVSDGSGRRLPVANLVERARSLMARGDLASAIEIIDEALTVEPGHGDARALKDDLSHRLGVLRMDALQPLERVPIADMGALAGKNPNPRALYLLTLVDGSLTLQDLIDLSGVSSLEAATLLSELIAEGALRFR